MLAFLCGSIATANKFVGWMKNSDNFSVFSVGKYILNWLEESDFLKPEVGGLFPFG